VLRTAALTIIGVAAIATAQAGQIITLGSNVSYNSSTGVYQSQNGLTSSYVSGTTSSCVGAQLYGNTCATGATGGFSEKNYNVTLFAGALNGTTPISAYSGAGGTYNSSTNIITPNATTGGKTLTSSSTSATYSMLNDNGGTNNFWDSTSTSAIVIPVGVQGVDAVYTMINDLWGAPGSPITVTFNFGANNSYTTTSSISVSLVEGATVSDAVECGAAGGTVTANSTSYNCTSYATGLTGSGSQNGISVTADQLTSTSSYTGTTSTTPAGSTICGSVYCGTSGSIALDEQDFNLSNLPSAYLSDYLVSISISDSSAVTYVSRAGLSAVSIDTVDAPVTTPEPSTLLLFGTGLVAVVFGSLRRKKAARVL